MKRLNANDTFEANRFGWVTWDIAFIYRLYAIVNATDAERILSAQMNESLMIANVNLSEKRSIMHFMNSCFARRSRIHIRL